MPSIVVRAAKMFGPQMTAAASHAVRGQVEAMNACSLFRRSDVPSERRLEPLTLAAIYKAIAPIYASLALSVRQARVHGRLRAAIDRRARQLSVFRRAFVAPCAVLRAWAKGGFATNAPLYRAIGASPSNYPRSGNGRGDPVIREAVDALRSRGYSPVARWRMRLALDPVLYSLA
jgi:hypothetical protein